MGRMGMIAVMVVLLSAGCATDAHKHRVADREALQRIGPQVGMSQDDIRLMYGEPRSVTETDSGESWNYDNVGMAFIPFNFGFRLKMSVFSFDNRGRLEHFAIGK